MENNGAPTPQQGRESQNTASEQQANGKPVNLTPGNGGNIPPVENRWKPGQSGNPRGRAITGPNLSDVIKNLMADEEFIDALVKNKPGWWDKLPKRNGGHAITAAMMAKALSGDQKAANWMAKFGWGDKVQHSFEGSFFGEQNLNVTVTKRAEVEDDDLKPTEKSEDISPNA